MLFADYIETGFVYHVVSLTDLEKSLSEGLFFDDKKTYKSKYIGFHGFFDKYKPENIPEWVIRQKSIFASLNFKNNHSWHSHTAILRVKINEDKCWVCNENIANYLYEPYILQKVRIFKEAEEFIKYNGCRIAQDYWSSSCSFKENLTLRNDKNKGYDAEILVMHHIPPEDIECLAIVSDHRLMAANEWKDFFASGQTSYNNC